MTDIIIIAVLLVVVGAAVAYIVKEKKQGKCIGCPYAKQCSGNCGGSAHDGEAHK